MNIKKIMVLTLAFLMVMPKNQAMDDGNSKMQIIIGLTSAAVAIYGLYMQYKQYKMMSGQTTSFTPLQSDMNFTKLNRDIHTAIQTLALFYKFPNSYSNKKPLSGIVLHGKPGAGKTELVRALAGEGVPVFALSGSQMMYPYMGSSEAALRNLFDTADNYRYGGFFRWLLNMPLHPLVCVFLDEMDSIGQKRGSGAHGNQNTDSVLNQLLTLLDGSQKYENLVTIAATNRLELLDDALLRSKRLGVKIKIEAPKKEEKLKIIKSKFDESGLRRTESLDDLLKKGLDTMITSDLIELPELCKTIKSTYSVLAKPKISKTSSGQTVIEMPKVDNIVGTTVFNEALSWIDKNKKIGSDSGRTLRE